MLERETTRHLGPALDKLDEGFVRELPAFAPTIPGAARMGDVLGEVAARMGDNFPYFHPLYAGQMLKPPHPIARAAYALATWINPNNHALDGGRASSALEREAVAALAAMFGWEEHLGHLTSGGTMANLEALWAAGQLGGGRKIVASEQAHYTHGRISAVLGLPFDSVATDARGRMDVAALDKMLAAGDVGCVVATLGTTAVGAVDPLPAILASCRARGVRVHVDAAYGGYFTLVDGLDAEARAAFDRIGEADSIVIDPHKHGLQPYGCGCVLFRDPAVGVLYKHDSPYTYFSSKELHLGEISLECSRPGAAAVALWATQRLLPLERGGELAQGLAAGRRAALELHRRLEADARFVTPFTPQLDIAVWAVRDDAVEAAGAAAQRTFDQAAERGLHLALAQLPVAFFAEKMSHWAGSERVTCLRSVLMKPEHEAWLDRIWDILNTASK